MSKIFLPELRLAKEAIKNFGSPLFLTDKKTLIDRVQSFKNSFKNKIKIFYAMKANFNPTILKTLKDAGIDGVDTVSIYEVKLAKALGFLPHEIIFTGNNLSTEEMSDVYKEGALLNIGSVSELTRFAVKFPHAKVSLRLNPSVGDGECEAVITGGDDCKFGINPHEVSEAIAICKKHNLNIIGIHCHIGSGFYKTENFKRAVKSMFEAKKNFSNLKFIDLGGGFGVRYSQNKTPINLEDFSKATEEFFLKGDDSYDKNVEIRFEPGKYLVSESTVLLTTITNIRVINDRTFVGVDSGFNHLIRPAFYNAYHHIINLSKKDSPLEDVTVVGNICESCDEFSASVKIGEPEEGDILAIVSTGAYGASMSSLYNLRPYAAEALFDGEKTILTRKRFDFNALKESLGFRYP